MIVVIVVSYSSLFLGSPESPVSSPGVRATHDGNSLWRQSELLFMYATPVFALVLMLTFGL